MVAVGAEVFAFAVASGCSDAVRVSPHQQLDADVHTQVGGVRDEVLTICFPPRRKCDAGRQEWGVTLGLGLVSILPRTGDSLEGDWRPEQDLFCLNEVSAVGAISSLLVTWSIDTKKHLRNHGRIFSKNSGSVHLTFRRATLLGLI